MAEMTEETGKKINDNIKLLIKAVQANGGGGAMSKTSSDESSNKKDSIGISEKVLQNSLKGNLQLLEIQRKIAVANEKILQIKSRDKKLEEQQVKYLEKQKALYDLQMANLTTMTAHQKSAHIAMLKASEIDYKNEAKKYSAIKKTIRLEQQEQEFKADWAEANKDEIKKQMVLEEKRAKRKKDLDNAGLSREKLKEKSGKILESAGEGIFNFGKKILSDILEQDSAMSKLSANYGLSRKESGLLKMNLSDAAITTSLIGIDAGELAKSQASYTDELGRSVLLSKEGLIAMAQIGVATGIGAEGAAKMTAEMDVFGYSVESSAELINNLMLKSKKNGVSSSVATKKLQENLKVANTYTFKDGLKGVADMTIYSTKFRINMSSIAGFADKISNPEGAIEAAASLQVLGGGFAQMSDPMKLLNQSMTDMEGLTDTYTKMLAGLGKVDKKTGEVAINGYDRMRIRAAADATGISIDEMMTTVRTNAKRTAIDTTLNLNPQIKGNEEAKNLIASLASYKEGKGFQVNVGGKAKSVVDLSKEDIEALQPKDDSLNLKTVAENTLGLKETFDAGMKSIEQAIMTKLFPLMGDIANILQKVFGTIADFMGRMFSKENGQKTSLAGGAVSGLGGALKFGGNMLAGGAGASAGTKVLGSGLGMLGKGMPLIGGLLSAGGEYASSGKAGRSIGAGVGGALLPMLAGLALTATGVGAGVGIPLMIAAGMAGSAGGAALGGMFDKGNDVLLPSKGNGKPIMLDSKDDVFAAKQGGALLQAISPSANAKKTFGGVSSSYGNNYRNGSSGVSGEINLVLSGTINISSGGSNSKLSAGELVKDQQFIRELTRIIGNQMNRDKNGGKFSGGLNNNSL